MKYVVSWIDGGKKASDLIPAVNIAKGIHWLKVAWKDVSTDTIVHSFQKCGLKTSEANSTWKDIEIDEEFAIILNQLCDDDDITVQEFITFDDHVTISCGQINTDFVNWREKAREEAIENVVPNDFYRNEGQKRIQLSWGHSSFRTYNITDIATSGQAAWILNKSNDETLSGLPSEVINAAENIKISSLRQSNIPRFFQEVLSNILLFYFRFS